MVSSFHLYNAQVRLGFSLVTHTTVTAFFVWNHNYFHMPPLYRNITYSVDIMELIVRNT